LYLLVAVNQNYT